ncbi:MAG: hypothetical protein ACREO3_04700 [Arenimonas sp.]
MRLAVVATPLLAVALLGACAKPEPSAFVAGQPMAFPMRSAGTFEDVGARLIAACREAGDPNNPDCALRIKNRLESCRGQVPGTFDTEAIYLRYTTDYRKCLEKR